MLKSKYFDNVEKLFEEIREVSSQSIREAAKLIADTVNGGNNVYVYDTGHIIDNELIARSGGLVLLRRFKYSLSLESDARIIDEFKVKSQEGLAKIALNMSDVVKGDVIIIGSVAGISPHVIDLALASKEIGVKVIAYTGIDCSKNLDSLHHSKKKLFELGDVVIDNCTKFGDAMFAVPGLKHKIIPESGIANTYIAWALVADIVECLQKEGINPTVLGSVNIPGNDVINIESEEEYKKKGY